MQFELLSQTKEYNHKTLALWWTKTCMILKAETASNVGRGLVQFLEHWLQGQMCKNRLAWPERQKTDSSYCHQDVFNNRVFIPRIWVWLVSTVSHRCEPLLCNITSLSRLQGRKKKGDITTYRFKIFDRKSCLKVQIQENYNLASSKLHNLGIF